MQRRTESVASRASERLAFGSLGWNALQLPPTPRRRRATPPPPHVPCMVGYGNSSSCEDVGLSRDPGAPISG
eukprot:6206029-Pleurochrysis_carterae.AAC.1